MAPLTGFTGSAFSMRLNLVAGRFTQNSPQHRENPPFRRFWPVSGPGRPQNSPRPPPKKVVNCELRPQEANHRKCQMCESCAPRTRSRWANKSPNNPPWRRVTAETAPCRKHNGSTRVRTRDLILLGWGLLQETSKSRHPTSST